MSEQLVIVGASGFGRETLDVVRAHNAARPGQAFELVGVVDDGPSPENLKRLDAVGVRYLGGLDDLLDAHAHAPARYVLGIGSPDVRARLVERMDAAGWRATALVHPDATLGSCADVGEGVVVCAGVQVSTNVVLGRHAHLNPNATIGHDAVLDEFVSINPGAIVSGDVRISSLTLVGAGAVVLQGLTVGARVTVGAGSVVTKDVEPGVVCAGVPARVLREAA